MVIYGSLGAVEMVCCSLTLVDMTGVLYVVMDLMMMLEMWHVDN